MKDDLKDAPALGLYLALFWLALIALPLALFAVGLREWWHEITDCTHAIRTRND